MPKFDGHPAGSPCWVDHVSTNQEGAKAFYAEVLGWNYTDMPVVESIYYSQAFSNGSNCAAIAPMAQELVDSGMASAWNVYFSTISASETESKISAAGGSVVMPAFDVMEFGRMTAGNDPQGAMFFAWESKSHKGFEVRDEIGAVAWLEVYSRDMDATVKFYADMFGWTRMDGDDSAGVRYDIFSSGDDVFGGAMEINDSDWDGVPAHWMVYFSVDDCDDAAERVKSAGGTIMNGPFDTPHGRIVVVNDPTGAVVSFIGPIPAA